MEIVCKANCSRRRFLFSRSFTFTFSLLCYPFRPSTLVIYRGYAADAHGGICTTRNRKKKKKKKERTRAGNSGFAILSFCFDHSASPWALCEQPCRGSDAMKRSTGCKGSARSAANNTLIFALAALMALARRGWKRNSRKIWCDEMERENCTRRIEKIKMSKRTCVRKTRC